MDRVPDLTHGRIGRSDKSQERAGVINNNIQDAFIEVTTYTVLLEPATILTSQYSTGRVQQRSATLEAIHN